MTNPARMLHLYYPHLRRNSAHQKRRQLRSDRSRMSKPQRWPSNLRKRRKPKVQKTPRVTSRKRSGSDLAPRLDAVLARATGLVPRHHGPQMLAAGAVTDPRVRNPEVLPSRKIRAKKHDVIAHRQSVGIRTIKTGTPTSVATDLLRELSERQMKPRTDGTAAVTVFRVGHGVGQHDATGPGADPPGEMQGGEPRALHRCALEIGIGIGIEKGTGTGIGTGMAHTRGGLDPVVGAHTDQIVGIERALLDGGAPSLILEQDVAPSRASEPDLSPGPRSGSALARLAGGRVVQTVSPSEPAHDRRRASRGHLHISIRMRKRSGSKSKSGSERGKPRPTWLHRKRRARRASRFQALTSMLTKTRAIALPT